MQKFCHMRESPTSEDIPASIYATYVLKGAHHASMCLLGNARGL